jgi:hypothetical protein
VSFSKIILGCELFCIGRLTLISPLPIALNVRPSAARIGSGLISRKLRNFDRSGEKWLLAPQSIMTSADGDAARALLRFSHVSFFSHDFLSLFLSRYSTRSRELFFFTYVYLYGQTIFLSTSLWTISYFSLYYYGTVTAAQSLRTAATAQSLRLRLRNCGSAFFTSFYFFYFLLRTTRAALLLRRSYFS